MNTIVQNHFVQAENCEVPADFSPEDLEEIRKLTQSVLTGGDPTEPLEDGDLDEDDIELEEEEDAEIDEDAIEEELSAVSTSHSIAADPLEELWRECDAAPGGHRRSRPERDLSRQLAEAERRLSSLYTNPDNWHRTRGVALVHAESKTLLGNFSEYVHNRIPSCRKLLRETALVPIDACEEVSGTWWLEPLAREHIEAAKHWQTQRAVIVPAHLDRLGVFCPAAPLILFLQFGGIMRVELSEDCMFASADGSVVIHLAKGVNVYECMEHEGKVALRREIVL